MSLYGGIELVGQPSLENVRRLDLLPMPCISEMMRGGFRIDPDYLNDLADKFTIQADDLKADICSYIPHDKLDEFIGRSKLDDEDAYLPMNVDSTDQLVELLFNVLGVGMGKKLKLTKGGKPSTGKKQMEQLKLEHPVVQKILSYRELAKLISTYCRKLPKIARWHKAGVCDICVFDGEAWVHDEGGWYIHTQILTTRTATGRLSSKSPNLQNIPARKAIGKSVRRGFVASPGMELVSVDWAQMEMRLGGHRSKDPNLKRIFDADLDVHTDTAIRAFGLPPGVKPDKHTQRDPSKITNFMIFYGATETGLFDQLLVNFAEAGIPTPEWLTLEWCKRFIDQWFNELYPSVKECMDAQAYRAKRYGVVWTMCGRINRVPEVRSVHNRIVAAGIRQCGNSPIQGDNADLLKIALAETHELLRRFRREGVRARSVMTIHDEWIGEVEQGWGDYLRWAVEEIFEKVMTDKQTGENYCSVPLKADSEIIMRWGQE